MIITILEFEITQENWGTLQTQFNKIIENVPNQIIQSLLTQNSKDLNSWKIVTVWKSKEDFMENRNNMIGQLPPAYLLLQSLGVEGIASMHNVIECSDSQR